MSYSIGTPVGAGPHSGPVTTRGIDHSRRDLDVSKHIARLDPEASPFAVLLMEAAKEVTNSNYFYWWDQRLGSWWDDVTAVSKKTETGDGLGNEITVTDGKRFSVNDVVKVPATNEIFLVTAIDGNKLTVARGYAGTTAAKLTTDHKVMRLAIAMEEFSRAPASRIIQPTKGWNVSQIFRTTFDQSMTSSAESVKVSENERTRLRKDKAVEHRIDIERAMLFGKPYQDPNLARQTTGGLMHFIENNVVSSSAFSEDVFDVFAEQLFEHGSNQKLLIVSRRVGTLINKIGKDRIETTSGEEFYGMRLRKVMTFHGDIILAPSKILQHEYENLAIGVDMKNIQYRPLKGRDTTLKTNIQNNDEDGWRDEYLTEAGLQVRLPETHWYLKLDTVGWNDEAEIS